MKQVKLLMMGFGNAARAYAKLLLEKSQEIQQQYGVELIVTGITTGTRGNLVDNNGLALVQVLEQVRSQGSFDSNWSCFSTLVNEEIINRLDYDVLVEMTPLNIHSGQPAISHIRGALARGKHVITANKGPIAWDFKALKEMAQQRGAQFFYETTVMDGAPIFNLYQHTLQMCKVTEVSGILNTTTNFVLHQMELGKSYEDAIEAGRKRGFVEADPMMDLEGYDAAAKITALLNVLMDADLKPTQIDKSGIVGVTPQLVAEAASRDKVLKLVCRGWMDNGKIRGEVKLKEIATDDLLASVKGTTSLVSITTDLMGKISIVEHDPEIEQTGYGLFSDTLRLLCML